MKNKCKICGYRFKSNDEVICPECFTARDEDISCHSFSDNEHSHNLHSTYKESNSFLDNERREERSDSFAKENYNNKSNANPTPQFNRPNQNTYRQNNANSFNRPNPQQFYHNGQTQNNTYRFNVPQYNNVSQQKNKGCGIVVAIIIIFVFLSVFIPVIKDIIDEFEYQNTMIESDSYQAFNFDYDNDEDQYYDESEQDEFYDPTDSSATLVSDEGNYTITVTGFSNVDIADDAIEAEEKDNTENLAENPDWNRLQVVFEYAVYDEEEDYKIPQLFEVNCIGYDIDWNTVSYSTHTFNESVTLSDDKAEFKADMLVDKSAVIADYTITMDNGEEFTFEFDFETDEVII